MDEEKTLSQKFLHKEFVFSFLLTFLVIGLFLSIGPGEAVAVEQSALESAPFGGQWMMLEGTIAVENDERVTMEFVKYVLYDDEEVIIDQCTVTILGKFVACSENFRKARVATSFDETMDEARESYGYAAFKEFGFGYGYLFGYALGIRFFTTEIVTEIEWYTPVVTEEKVYSFEFSVFAGSEDDIYVSKKRELISVREVKE